jgi:hypothetical protein
VRFWLSCAGEGVCRLGSFALARQGALLPAPTLAAMRRTGLAAVTAYKQFKIRLACLGARHATLQPALPEAVPAHLLPASSPDSSVSLLQIVRTTPKSLVTAEALALQVTATLRPRPPRSQLWRC